MSILHTALWLFIISVSSFDGYLVYRHRSQMLAFEMNPLGQALLRLNEGRVWYLLIAKAVGTAAVCGTLLTVWRLNKQLGLVLTASIAAIQLALVLWLVMR